jgi:hypothetical protein
MYPYTLSRKWTHDFWCILMSCCVGWAKCDRNTYRRELGRKLMLLWTPNPEDSVLSLRGGANAHGQEDPVLDSLEMRSPSFYLREKYQTLFPCTHLLCTHKFVFHEFYDQFIFLKDNHRSSTVLYSPCACFIRAVGVMQEWELSKSLKEKSFQTFPRDISRLPNSS